MAWDPVWEEVFSRQAWGQYPGEELIRFVARNYYGAPDRAKVRALELGCGPGANLWFLARQGFAFTGIDGSATAVAQAAERLDAECPGWRERGAVRVSDMQVLPYGDASFDMVIDHEAVYCNAFDTSVTIYQEAARVLKPGGMMFVRTFASGSWGDGSGEALGHHAWLCSEGPLAGKGYSRFTAFDEIASLLEGFDILAVEELASTREQRQHMVREWIITGVKK